MRMVYPGQVSVTSATWLSAQHALPEGVSPVDLGAHIVHCCTTLPNGGRLESGAVRLMEKVEPSPMYDANSRANRHESFHANTYFAGEKCEYDVSLFHVSHRVLHDRYYPPLRSVRCTSPGYYDSPNPQQGVAICFCKPIVPKNCSPDVVEESRQQWADLARAILPAFYVYECKSPEKGQFTLAFKRLEHAVAFCTSAQLYLAKLPEKKKKKKGRQEISDEIHAGIYISSPETDTVSLPVVGRRSISVAMGIAFGTNCFRKPLIETGRADYFGPLANLAARVMSKACGGQVLVEGIPLLWRTGKKMDVKSVMWKTETTLDEAELWCERKKDAPDVTLGLLNVPWSLSVNAARALREYFMQDDDAEDHLRSQDTNHRHVTSTPGYSDIITSLVRGDLHDFISEVEDYVNESAILLCTQGFCELKGFPSRVTLLEARSPLLKPAKFPRLNADTSGPITQAMMNGPCPPKAWEITPRHSQKSQQKLQHASAKVPLTSVVFGDLRGKSSSHPKPGHQKDIASPTGQMAARKVASMHSGLTGSHSEQFADPMKVLDSKAHSPRHGGRSSSIDGPIRSDLRADSSSHARLSAPSISHTRHFQMSLESSTPTADFTTPISRETQVPTMFPETRLTPSPPNTIKSHLGLDREEITSTPRQIGGMHAEPTESHSADCQQKIFDSHVYLTKSPFC